MRRPRVERMVARLGRLLSDWALGRTNKNGEEERRDNLLGVWMCFSA